jgi:hypothetical protein
VGKWSKKVGKLKGELQKSIAKMVSEAEMARKSGQMAKYFYKSGQRKPLIYKDFSSKWSKTHFFFKTGQKMSANYQNGNLEVLY